MANEPARFQPRPAVRFIFEYRRRRGAARGAAGRRDGRPRDQPGERGRAWVYLDARDAAERTLARVAAPGAFSRSAEVFPERHEEPIARIDVAAQRGAFTVTLPAVEQADHVTVVRVVAGTDSGPGLASAARAVDVASFPLSRR